MSEKVYKRDQIAYLSGMLNIPKTWVEDILETYLSYLSTNLKLGKTIRVFNICYIVVDGESNRPRETLAYTATEIAKITGYSPSVVYRLLSSFEEWAIGELRSQNGCIVKGLVSLNIEESDKGNRVRARKSCVFGSNNKYDYSYRVTMLGSFKRRVELDRSIS